VLGRELYGLDDADSLYNCKAIAAILTAAETEWINAERAREIAKSLLPPPPAEPVDEIEEIKAELAAREERRAAERAAQAEIDDILDGPPPELPPAPEPVADDFTLKSFNEAVATLFRLHTKPLNSFTAAAHAPAILNTIARFMTEVAGQSADPICSYCCSERTRASTGKLPLFKGERAYICAECIEIATGMLADLKAKKVVEPAQAHPF
jgi:hypothetical protein